MPPDQVDLLLAGARQAIAPLDARLLLQHATGLDHARIIAEPGGAVAAAAAAVFQACVMRRRQGEPVARIIGRREFYGREFLVTPAVLDPRPDTETLIDEVLARCGQAARILDLGTGSGAIIITLLAERTEAIGVAVDISAGALAVARANAAGQGVARRLSFIHGSWFDDVEGQFDIIVSNPPYIQLAAIAALAADVRDFDPLPALDGGPDGLAAFRSIARGAGAHLAPGGCVSVEIGAGQETEVARIFNGAGYALVSSRRDLGGHWRCLTFCGRAQN